MKLLHRVPDRKSNVAVKSLKNRRFASKQDLGLRSNP
jgi:hypothetical protein